MSKIIRNTHISGEAGVLKFADYCNRHIPYIIFREVVKNDFGVDGEIELTHINADRKTEPLGEIMKVQIKTVGSIGKNTKKTAWRFFLLSMISIRSFLRNYVMIYGNSELDTEITNSGCLRFGTNRIRN